MLLQSSCPSALLPHTQQLLPKPPALSSSLYPANSMPHLPNDLSDKSAPSLEANGGKETESAKPEFSPTGRGKGMPGKEHPYTNNFHPVIYIYWLTHCPYSVDEKN